MHTWGISAEVLHPFAGRLEASPRFDRYLSRLIRNRLSQRPQKDQQQQADNKNGDDDADDVTAKGFFLKCLIVFWKSTERMQIPTTKKTVWRSTNSGRNDHCSAK